MEPSQSLQVQPTPAEIGSTAAVLADLAILEESPSIPPSAVAVWPQVINAVTRKCGFDSAAEVFTDGDGSSGLRVDLLERALRAGLDEVSVVGCRRLGSFYKVSFVSRSPMCHGMPPVLPITSRSKSTRLHAEGDCDALPVVEVDRRTGAYAASLRKRGADAGGGETQEAIPAAVLQDFSFQRKRLSLKEVVAVISPTSLNGNIKVHTKHLESLLRNSKFGEPAHQASFSRSFARIAHLLTNGTALAAYPSALLERHESRQRKKNKKKTTPPAATDASTRANGQSTSSSSSSRSDDEATRMQSNGDGETKVDADASPHRRGPRPPKRILRWRVRVVRNLVNEIADALAEAATPLDTAPFYFRLPEEAACRDPDLRRLFRLDAPVEGVTDGPPLSISEFVKHRAKDEAQPMTPMSAVNDAGTGVSWLEVMNLHLELTPLAPKATKLPHELQQMILLLTRVCDTKSCFRDRVIVDPRFIEAATKLPGVVDACKLRELPHDESTGLPTTLTCFDIALGVYLNDPSTSTLDVAGYAVDSVPSALSRGVFLPSRGCKFYGYTWYAEAVNFIRAALPDDERARTHPLARRFHDRLRNLVISYPCQSSRAEYDTDSVPFDGMERKVLPHEVGAMLDPKSRTGFKVMLRPVMRYLSFYDAELRAAAQQATAASAFTTRYEDTTATWLSREELLRADAPPRRFKIHSFPVREIGVPDASQVASDATPPSGADAPDVTKLDGFPVLLKEQSIDVAAAIDAMLITGGSPPPYVASRFLAILDARSYDPVAYRRIMRQPGADVDAALALPLPAALRRFNPERTAAAVCVGEAEAESSPENEVVATEDTSSTPPAREEPSGAAVPSVDFDTAAADEIRASMERFCDPASPCYVYGHAFALVDFGVEPPTVLRSDDEVRALPGDRRRKLRHVAYPQLDELHNTHPMTASLGIIANVTAGSGATATAETIHACIGELRRDGVVVAAATAEYFTELAGSAKSERVRQTATLAAKMRTLLEESVAATGRGVGLAAELDDGVAEDVAADLA